MTPDDTTKTNGLALEMGPGQLMLINGAVLLFEKRAVVVVTSSDARVLAANKVMSAEAATTPIRRLYLAMQRAYMWSTPEEGTGAKIRALAAIAELKADPPWETAGQMLDHVARLIENGGWYEALATIHRAIRHTEESSQSK